MKPVSKSPPRTVRQLEEYILGGSGLGVVAAWGNGCGAWRVREDAQRRTENVLIHLHKEGEPVALPDASLTRYIGAAAHFLDEAEWDLQRTWQVTSEVARVHIYLGMEPNAENHAKICASFLHVMETYYALVPGCTFDLGGGEIPYPSYRGRSPGAGWAGIVRRAEQPLGSAPFPSHWDAVGRETMDCLGLEKKS